MRVVSLLPAATEIVSALGGEGRLVAVSHECDWPRAVTRLPRVTTSPIDPAAPSGAIDRAVRELRAAGRPVIAVDAARLAELQPDLILTQDLCEVCAVSDGQVFRLADALTPAPAVLSLSAPDLDGIYADIDAVGRALDLEPEAEELVAGMRYRLRVLAPAGTAERPRVVAVEWLDPLFLAGHWVPELIAAAGGIDAGASPGAHSVQITPEALEALAPDVVIVMLCGFGVDRALRELAATPLPALGAPVWVLDGNAYTSRPGPRVVDGAVRIRAAISGREMAGLVRAPAAL